MMQRVHCEMCPYMSSTHGSFGRWLIAHVKWLDDLNDLIEMCKHRDWETLQVLLTNCWPIEKTGEHNWGAPVGSNLKAPELLERFAVLESPAGVWTPRMVAFSENWMPESWSPEAPIFRTQNDEFCRKMSGKGQENVWIWISYLTMFVQTRGPTWDWSCHSQKAESETAQSSTFFWDFPS